MNVYIGKRPIESIEEQIENSNEADSKWSETGDVEISDIEAPAEAEERVRESSRPTDGTRVS